MWAYREYGRAFLHYTEYGGYYVEPHIHRLDPALVADVPQRPCGACCGGMDFAIRNGF